MSVQEHPKALTVAQFLTTVNRAFEEALFPHGAEIEGEVAEYRVSQGKWVWFKLKDEKEEGVVDCFATVWQMKTPLEDGMKVRAHGRPQLFKKSGKFTVTVDRVEPLGEGALKRAYELLKKKLEAEGLFAPGRKRGLPRFPERLGLIASTESAAYTDFLRILRDRWGGVKVTAAHVQVQGREAVRDIVGAFRYFNAHPELAEALVLTRGGGSMEDLHAFNSEEVARAIFASRIPVVVGVGHERDETLADFVADVRASTPSNAAERLVPDRRDIGRELAAMTSFMDSSLREELHGRTRRLDELEGRLQEHVRSARAEFEAVMHDLAQAFSSYEGRVQKLRTTVDGQERLLKSFDPRGVLKRGYAIVRGSDGRLLRDASGVDTGERVRVQLHKGNLEADVVTTS